MATRIRRGGKRIRGSDGKRTTNDECCCGFPCADIEDLHDELPTFAEVILGDIAFTGFGCTGYDDLTGVTKAIFTGGSTVIYADGSVDFVVTIECEDDLLSISAAVNIEGFSRVLTFAAISVTASELLASGTNTFSIPYTSSSGSSSCTVTFGADPRFEFSITNP